MTINSDWVKKDFKQKYYLFCQDCISEFPQKSLKETERRDKIINIVEIRNEE